GKKLELRFERQEAKKAEGKKAEKDGSETIRLVVRLDFSDHEKLSHQRWLDRIPAEEPFKSAKAEVVRHGEGGFVKTAELFDSLTERARGRPTRRTGGGRPNPIIRGETL